MQLLKHLFGGTDVSKKKKKSVHSDMEPWSLDNPLLHFGSGDVWTLREALTGTQIFGGTGSGKTSGSGKAIAGSFLKLGMGGIILTAKKDERELWEGYCKKYGRLGDLIIFGENQPYRFNFLDYELNRKGEGAGKTENLVKLFMTIMEMADPGKGSSNNKDRFWDKSLEEMLTNGIELLKYAKGNITVHDMYRVINSAPKSLEDVSADHWKQHSFCNECLGEAASKIDSDDELADYHLLLDYWLETFPNLDEKTRSIIVVSFTGLANSFIRGPLKKLFSNDTTITPEVILDGRIIVLDLPEKEYGEIGVYAQGIFKYMTQKAMERRNIKENDRPVFIWADESQYFINSYDATFLTTARSSRVATVYLTQNISNYYTVMNGRNAKAATDSFLANMLTKVFHANNDSVTNLWASDTIGKQKSKRFGGSSNNGNGSRSSVSFNDEMQYPVSPYEFTVLRNGGPANDLSVDAILTVAAKTWKRNSKNYLKVSFKQS